MARVLREKLVYHLTFIVTWGEKITGLRVYQTGQRSEQVGFLFYMTIGNLKRD